METMRDIKRRISSVENTQKITRAMKMVASAKLRKAQEKAERSRPFYRRTRRILGSIVSNATDVQDHPLLSSHGGDKHLYIVVSADRGLCGAYNNRVIERTEESISGTGDACLVTLGKNARDYFRRGSYDVASEYVDIADYPDLDFAREISSEIISLYTEKKVDRVSIIYTHFNSAISQEVKRVELLPVSPPEELEGELENPVDYIFEPSPVEILDILLPRYVHNLIYTFLLESKASEFGARMTAMDSATDNAGEIIEELTLSYNRARQSQITREITEIVGGAEALK
ncbi:MAG: ATP synthase F1 subunit gamma [Bacillota bacterium]